MCLKSQIKEYIPGRKGESGKRRRTRHPKPDPPSFFMHPAENKDMEKLKTINGIKTKNRKLIKIY